MYLLIPSVIVSNCNTRDPFYRTCYTDPLQCIYVLALLLEDLLEEHDWKKSLLEQQNAVQTSPKFTHRARGVGKQVFSQPLEGESCCRRTLSTWLLVVLCFSSVERIWRMRHRVYVA